MKKLFNLFIDGFKTLITLPFWLTFFIIKMVEALCIFLFKGITAIILFFQGKSIFKTKEDKAISLLIIQDQSKMAQRRSEAMKNAD